MGFIPNQRHCTKMEGDLYIIGKRLQEKTNLECLSSDEIISFKTDYPTRFATLKSAYNLLMFGEDETTESNRDVLIPMKIETCNAYHDIPFSGCHCSVQQYDAGLRFGLVFGKGLDVLFHYLKENKLPTDRSELLALRKLLTFFGRNLDSVVTSDVRIEDEAQVCLFLMNHLVSQLSICEDWKMDIGTNKKGFLKCPCYELVCPLKHPPKEHFMDLSIGNKEVWHGCPDAMTVCELPVVLLGEDGDTDTEVEYESCFGLEFKESAKDQLYGETIVYSFLQKILQKELSFVPVLGIKRDAFIVAMYDSALDVLLTSPVLSFVGENEQLSCVAFLILWLTCNFKQFSTALTGPALERIGRKNADFKKFVKEKFKVYQEHLHFQHARPRKKEKELVMPVKRKMEEVLDSYKL